MPPLDPDGSTRLRPQHCLALALTATALAMDAQREANMTGGQSELIRAAFVLLAIAEDHQAAQDYCAQSIGTTIVSYLLALDNGKLP